MIVTIFGKKGSGKSVLSKDYMMRLGGRVIFLSPVESLALRHIEIWRMQDIPVYMQHMQPGNVLLLRLAHTEALDVVCAQCIADPQGYTLIIDEMDRYYDSTELIDAIHYSRHFDIHIVANTRRYVNMPRLLTSQADELCVFKSQEPRDLDYLRMFVSKEFSESCKTLPEYHYLHYPSGEILQGRNLQL